jgi:hypothetical protein
MPTLFSHSVFKSTRKKLTKRQCQSQKIPFEIEPLELRRLLTSLTPIVETPSFAAEISPLVPAGAPPLSTQTRRRHLLGLPGRVLFKFGRPNNTI